MRVWENLVGRSSGPMNVRLIVQPTVAAIIAIRAGLSDARNGRPVFLWAAATNPVARRELLVQGWKDVGTVFILAGVLDAVYQLLVHHGVFVLELLVVATTLAIVPYILIRGPAARVGRWLANRSDDAQRDRGK